ncbi:hypothetical protein EYB26_000915 [Talaromyces marneffei]|uniref:uncharacterized protein n=1 Tax=Talaromyces marneffei TaxID=37727 RepID=UPI0012A817E6|nr:uncharacterized protein EYB26_000915 [Talaromyces marneffei]QGA13267.1 hypothetical protein EYB26_000915 [Talaromyces marneffei]
MAPYLGLRGMPLVIAITAACSTGFLLFGYDNGVFSGLTTDEFFLTIMGSPNSTLLGFIVAVYELGCLVGALASFFWGEALGRRWLTVSGAVWLIIVAYWVDYGCSSYTNGFQWRFPIAFQIVFAIMLIVMCFLLPESPRWLASHGREQEALEVVCLLRDGNPEDENIRTEMAEIKDAIALEEEAASGWMDCFRDGGVMGWQRVAIACSAQALQEFTGTNIITYYAPYVMVNSVGLDAHQSLLLSGGLQLWFLVASILPWFFLDKIGRRKLFFLGSAGMGACMLISGLTIRAGTHNAGIGAVVVLYMFQAFFTWGWMSNMWAYPSEILPIRLRQTGSALSVVWQWLITFLVVEITPVGIQNIGWKLYIVFCILNWATIVVVYFFYPETAGKSLEQIDFLFASQSSLRQVVKLSQRKDLDEMAVIRETQAQVHQQKADTKQVEDTDAGEP